MFRIDIMRLSIVPRSTLLTSMSPNRLHHQRSVIQQRFQSMVVCCKKLITAVTWIENELGVEKITFELVDVEGGPVATDRRWLWCRRIVTETGRDADQWLIGHHWRVDRNHQLSTKTVVVITTSSVWPALWVGPSINWTKSTSSRVCKNLEANEQLLLSVMQVDIAENKQRALHK